MLWRLYLGTEQPCLASGYLGFFCLSTLHMKLVSPYVINMNHIIIVFTSSPMSSSFSSFGSSSLTSLTVPNLWHLSPVGASQLNSHIKLSKYRFWCIPSYSLWKCLKCKCNMNTIIGVGVVAVNISILYLHQSTRTICSCDVCSGKDGLENVVGKISFNQHNLSHILE